MDDNATTTATSSYTLIEHDIVDSDEGNGLNISARLLLYEIIRKFAAVSKTAKLSEAKRLRPITFGPANVGAFMSANTYRTARKALEDAGFIHCKDAGNGLWILTWTWKRPLPKFDTPLPKFGTPAKHPPTKICGGGIPKSGTGPYQNLGEAPTKICDPSITKDTLPPITVGEGPIGDMVAKLARTMAALPEEHDLEVIEHDQAIAKVKAAGAAQADRATLFRREASAVPNGKVAEIVVRHVSGLYGVEANGCMAKIADAVVKHGARSVIDAAAEFIKDGRDDKVRAPFSVLLSRMKEVAR